MHKWNKGNATDAECFNYANRLLCCIHDITPIRANFVYKSGLHIPYSDTYLIYRDLMILFTSLFTVTIKYYTKVIGYLYKICN